MQAFAKHEYNKPGMYSLQHSSKGYSGLGIKNTRRKKVPMSDYNGSITSEYSELSNKSAVPAHSGFYVPPDDNEDYNYESPKRSNNKY